MTNRGFAVALVCGMAMATAPVRAQAPAEAAEISAAVQRYIDALGRRDTSYIRAASLPSATFVSVAVPAQPGQTAVVRSVDDQIDGMARDTRKFVGRVWAPRISIEGGIAVFIAPFDVWLDGRFTYCGIDHYVFVRSGERWLVSQLLYTRQREHCEPAPMGPPN